ncbi:hypothetical protein FRC12_014393, partial [Ceratobasidium sp. 428]
MPPKQKKNKSRVVATTPRSTFKPKNSKFAVVEQSTSNPRQATDADESLSVVHAPVDDITRNSVEELEKEDSVELDSSDIVSCSDKGIPLDVTTYALEDSAPPLSDIVKCNTLNGVIQQNKYITAVRAARGDSLVPFLAPLARTGHKPTDRAMNDLRASQADCIWIGDSYKLFQNSKWHPSKQSNVSTLQWSDDAPNRPIGSSENVIVGFIGRVLLDEGLLNPGGGWQ